MMLSTACLTLFLVVTAVAAEPMRVTTSGGQKIIGHPSVWKPNVSEYLGIRYARAPNIERRWAPPERFEANPAYTIVASKYSPDCPANVRPNDSRDAGTPRGEILGYMGQEGHTFDENCLSLNIWTKPGAGEQKKAVMVWFGGFGFEVGSSATPLCDGARLADEHEVIVVSINYRLNIFGFPNAKFLPHQNLGLLDQRMALEWIRDNIGVFGGDAARITLFGSSAGASSIDMHRYAWAEDPIAAGFILQSGNRMIRGGGAWPGLGGKPGPSGNLSINETIGGFPSMEGSSSCGGVWTSDESRQCDQNSAWFFASTKVGCGGKEAGERTLTCMRSKPWKDVLDAIKPIPYIPALGTGQFGPIVDEKLVFGDYNNRTLAGNVAKQPLISGNTRAEVGLYPALIGLPNIAFDFIHDPGFPSGFMFANARLAIHSSFACGAGNAVRAHRQAGLKAWRYEYAGEFPNLNISVQGGGSYHSSEVPLVFGSSEHGLKMADTEEEKKLGQQIRTAWTTFAKNPKQGLEKLGWPLYDNKRKISQVFGNGSWWDVQLQNSSDPWLFTIAHCDGSTEVKDYESAALASGNLTTQTTPPIPW